MRSILVIDCGSSSMRGILFGEDGSILHTEQRRYFMTVDGDIAVQGAEDYRRSFLEICRVCGEEAARRDLELSAMSITSQRSSVLPLDRAGRPLGLIMTWYDKRALPICREKLAAFGGEIRALTGTNLTPVLSAPKMLYCKRYMPAVYDAAYKLVGIHDYLLTLCTGEFVTDVTLASRSSLMDIHTLQWSARLLEIFEIDADKLCRLLPAGTVAGKVTEAFAAESGLPENLPVVSGGGDQQCSVLGQGLFRPGQIGVTCGTGAYAAAVCDRPLIAAHSSLNWNASACPGLWVAEASIPAAGSVFDWFNRSFYDPAGQSYPQEHINAEIVQSPPGANGLRMCTDLNKGGSISGIDFSHTRADFARAMLEGIAGRIAGCIGAIQDEIGAAQTIRTTGGLSRLPEFNQIISDMIDFSLENNIIKETTAIGAFLVGTAAIGWYGSSAEAYNAVFGSMQTARYDPIPEHVVLYRQVIEKVNDQI